MKQNSQSGFTLVELSIVLVIIGLIIGGILAGADMIKAAQIRKAVSEFESYTTAVNTFRNKYGGIPGDLKNATQFWGEAAAGNACALTDSGGQETCNGDGNGIVEMGSVATSVEMLRFWQHLANANLISGLFTGVPIVGWVDIGNNTPESTGFKGSMWSVADRITSLVIMANTAKFYTLYGNNLVLAKKNPSGPLTIAYPAFSPLDAYNIDNKIDDGKPAKGKVVSYNITICTTAASAADTDADYLRDVADGELCSLGFVNVF